tara:strand:- start:2418 stop:4016 length:1599 start_codon:yes stop_codon:yes gene_type:complete
MEYSQGGKTAAGRYEQLASARSTFEREAKDSSKLTLPSLIPESTTGTRARIKTPFQALGAKAVNSLASKLLIALLPPSTAFFKLTIDQLQLMQEGQTEIQSEIDKGLRAYENALMDEIEVSNDRVAMFEALKHLIVGGNVLLYLTDKGLKVYPLSKFVSKRDSVGNVLEIITKESISPKALPPKFLSQIQQKDNYDEKTMGDEIDIYTCIKRYGDDFMWHQECKGEKIPGSDGRSKADVSPWILLRWVRIDGEDYGRGYVEEYRGDLISLEALTQAVIEGAAASAKVLFLVNPNGQTRASTLAKAPNGAIREGSAADVSVMQVGKQGDFAVAQQAMQRIEARLADAFLMASSVQRQAERVTAAEINLLAQELENSLGGTYSILSQEFQIPFLKRRMHMMVRSGKVKALPEKLVKPKIVTGIQGLGRGNDRNKLIEFIGTVAQALGPDVMRQFVNVDEAVKRLATSIGIDTTNLIKTAEQIAAEQQQAQQQQLIQSLGPAALGSKLLDPKNNAQAQQLTEELNANQEEVQGEG